MDFDTGDLDFFLDKIYENTFSKNDGGMKTPDLFTFHFLLKKLKPDVVIESGVWKGISTKIIRKTLGDDINIVCLDPTEFKGMYKDTNPNTEYFIGKNFIDFKDLDLSKYSGKKILVFFDDHQNAVDRFEQSAQKDIKYIFFNDNYPVNCGSHLTLEHQFNIDSEKTQSIKNKIEKYIIFPNIFGNNVITREGNFSCKYLFENYINDIHFKYKLFYEERLSYRWNTFVTLF